MLVHDARLSGNPPGNLAENTYRVDQGVAIAHAVGWIADYARRSSGLSDLYIMCHGFEGNFDLRNQTSVNRASGGFGLQLCKEGLSLWNTQLVSAWNSQIRKITIFACATADTASYNAGTAADGMRFCGEIALLSGAEVVAATQTQFYAKKRGLFEWLTRRNQVGTIDFGDWEGPVYSFTTRNPNGVRIN